MISQQKKHYRTTQLAKDFACEICRVLRIYGVVINNVRNKPGREGQEKGNTVQEEFVDTGSARKAGIKKARVSAHAF